MLPNQFIFDQAVGAQEIGAYGAILDEANDARMLFLPVRVSIAFRLVDLHNGSVQSLTLSTQQPEHCIVLLRGQLTAGRIVFGSGQPGCLLTLRLL